MAQLALAMQMDSQFRITMLNGVGLFDALRSMPACRLICSGRPHTMLLLPWDGQCPSQWSLLSLDLIARSHISSWQGIFHLEGHCATLAASMYPQMHINLSSKASGLHCNSSITHPAIWSICKSNIPCEAILRALRADPARRHCWHAAWEAKPVSGGDCGRMPWRALCWTCSLPQV